MFVGVKSQPLPDLSVEVWTEQKVGQLPISAAGPSVKEWVDSEEDLGGKQTEGVEGVENGQRQGR
jgi:hypothetical protein